MKNKCMQFLLLLGVIVFSINTNAQPAQKYRLKVLFVGYDPAKPMPEGKRFYPGMMSKEAFTAELPLRMSSFKELLGTYFTEVQTMDCRDWKPGDSDPYDVTVFDFRTTAIDPGNPGTPEKNYSDYRPAKYLPDNYSKPSVFISSTASDMGAAIGLKLDWLCLCLDADAHHVNTQHAIFNGPVEKVVPTMEMKNTPDGVYHYTTGSTVPKQIPMWKVQTVGYLEKNDCRIGLVSRGNRFLEGPDAEVISSGVCQKDVGAVALGRHGNFFLWGFGASPAQMTEEAKKVFVNVVAYMKQFSGKTPIARKYNEKMATTDDVREVIANTTKEKFEEYREEIKQFNENNAKEKKRIDEKKAAGQALTSSEEESLNYLGHDQPLPVWEDFIKGQMRGYAAKFGTDAEAFRKYMNDNFDYLYCDPNAFFDYSIDEDAQKIGVSNHSVKMLDACVDMLKRNDRPALALTVLKKYTSENFTTAKEWSKWLSKNRKKLFFCETDGYKFMVNTYN